MAESKNRMSHARAEIEKAKKKQEKELKKTEMEESKAEFNERLDNLATLAIDYEQTRGLEDPITQLIMSFLNIALEMQEMMQTVEAVSLAMQCVNEAIVFLDTANKMDEVMLDTTLETKYNIFTVWKQKIQHRRAINNHKKRIKSFARSLGLKFDMARAMVDAMQDFAKSIQKTSIKQQKKNGTVSLTPRADAFLSAKRQGTKAPDTSTPPTSGGTASGDTDYGDIFH